MRRRRPCALGARRDHHDPARGAQAGDHLLVCDNAYRPTRNFCSGLLARFGVETGYFDLLIGGAIAELFKPNTKAVLVEAPGSQSFEMPDIPVIASAAHARGALVVDDNTWATPLFHRSLEHGVAFESLVIPFDCAGYRTATPWAPGGPTLRFHIGLENIEDLTADLARGFEAFNAA
jgi:cystathionine beta-lyase/cystathionine gamma-synthase